MTPDNRRAAVSFRFAMPSAALSPFITTYYRTDVVTSDGEPWLEDYLHPEWPNLRFIQPGMGESAVGGADLQPTASFSVTGPTCSATRFRTRAGRCWGIGLMPLGWASVFKAQASDYADRIVDGGSDPAFAAIQPLAKALAETNGGFGEELAIIEAHMAQIEWRTSRQADAIARLNAALVDPEIATVADLAERVDMNIRSLERLAKRAFGFSPKLLMRRQRFLRSLAQFMLDPSLTWLSTLDYQYHDQAHFVRDFKRFMGMAPSAYSKLEKPLLVAAAQARMATAGQAMQVLHDPAADGAKAAG
ncbi:MAG: helix-turn-helix domain-containing protein [Pseudomonadota bacterium]